MKILIICRGPIADEALRIISNTSLAKPHILISRKEWLDTLENQAPWIYDWNRFEKIHAVDEYSDIKAIIRIVKQEKLDAVYPGYGFLAENAYFAKQCEKENICFIGPNSQTLEMMGLKDQARRICQEIGVPVTPGTDSLEHIILEKEMPANGTIFDALQNRMKKLHLEITFSGNSITDAIAEAIEYAAEQQINLFSDEEFIATAKEEVHKIWKQYGEMPIRIKASAGGGGKGQRVFSEESQLDKAMREVWNEIGASKVGGNKSVILEANIEKPRHMEVQIFGDGTDVVHFGIRDCSFQTMFYQKLIEIGVHEHQAESIYADDPEEMKAEQELIRGLQNSAVKITKHIGYKNAGTVEFLVDSNRNFYFMEVNARIQVEHGVSEEISRIKQQKFSLIGEQIRIASGEKLGYTQDDISFTGYALETRISMLDSFKLQPAPGATIQEFFFAKGDNIRIEDSGIEASLKQYREICPPAQYDANIALNIYMGNTFAEMLDNAIVNLSKAEIAGKELATTIPFHISVLTWLRHQKAKTKITTQFVEIHLCLLQLYKNELAGIKKEVEKTALEHKRNPFPCLSLVSEIIKNLVNDPSLAVSFMIQNNTMKPAQFIKKLAEYLNVNIWTEDKEYLNRLDSFESNIEIIAQEIKIPKLDYKELQQEQTSKDWQNITEVIAKEEKQTTKIVWQKLKEKYNAIFHLKTMELIHKLQITLEKLPHKQLTTLPNGTIQIPENLKDKKDRTKILNIVEHQEKQENAVVSPILGIFYRSPKPDLPPFVKIGQQVKTGQTLFVTGAMKVYTEVQAPRNGCIKEILVKDGKLVKQGEVIMILE